MDIDNAVKEMRGAWHSFIYASKEEMEEKKAGYTEKFKVVADWCEERGICVLELFNEYDRRGHDT